MSKKEQIKFCLFFTALIADLCQFETENVIMLQKIHTHIDVIFSMILKHCVTSLNHTHDHSLCFWRELLLQRALSYLLNKSSLSKETLDFWKCSSTFTTVCTVRLELSFAFICALLKGGGYTKFPDPYNNEGKNKSTKSDFFARSSLKVETFKLISKAKIENAFDIWNPICLSAWNNGIKMASSKSSCMHTTNL